jgi:hypothetical protein
VRLAAASGDVAASALAISGRPVRVQDDAIFWIFLGADHLEIRAAPLSSLAGG